MPPTARVATPNSVSTTTISAPTGRPSSFTGSINSTLATSSFSNRPERTRGAPSGCVLGATHRRPAWTPARDRAQATSIAAAIAIGRDADALEWIWLIDLQRLDSAFCSDASDQLSRGQNLARPDHRSCIGLRLVFHAGMALCQCGIGDKNHDDGCKEKLFTHDPSPFLSPPA